MPAALSYPIVPLNDKMPWNVLETWSPVGFVVGGISWLILMSIVGAGLVASVSTPPWLFPLFLVIGLFAAYVGLLGLYPRVTDASPRLSMAGVGVVVAAASLVAFAVVFTVATGTVDEGPPFPVFPGIILLTILSFLTVGVASVRSSDLSRTVGLLVLVPAIAWFGDILLIVATTAFGTGQVGGISLEVVAMVGVVLAAVSMIATGFLLRTRSSPAGRAEAPSDSTA